MWLSDLAKFLQYIGASALFGTSYFLIVFIRPHGTSITQMLKWPKKLFAFASLTLISGALFSIIASAAMMNDVPLNSLKFVQVIQIATETDQGEIACLRIVLGVAGLIWVLVSSSTKYFLKILCSIGLALMISLTFTGHGMKDEGTAGIIHLSADIAHVLAAGLWIGALFGFLFLLLSPPTSELQGVIHKALSKFSGLGSFVVAMIVLSGLVNSYFLIGVSNVIQIFSSYYGILLVTKIGLFILMLILAALNRFVLTTKFGDIIKHSNYSLNITNNISNSIILETALGLIVLLLVSFLGSLDPFL